MKYLRIISVLVILASFSFQGFAQRDDLAPFSTESGALDRMVQLYPNPATEYLMVKLPTPHANTAKLAMHSVIGNVLNMDKEVVDDYEIRIRVRDLPSGYYFLSIKDEESGLKATYKFLRR